MAWGYVANRVYFAMIAEAQKVVNEGIATADEVDQLMMDCFRWPSGPFGMVKGADQRLELDAARRRARVGAGASDGGGDRLAEAAGAGGVARGSRRAAPSTPWQSKWRPSSARTTMRPSRQQRLLVGPARQRRANVPSVAR